VSSGADDDAHQQNLGNESKDVDFVMDLMGFRLQPISVSSDQPVIPPCYFLRWWNFSCSLIHMVFIASILFDMDFPAYIQGGFP